VTLWNRGDEVLRVTARKDQWGEVQSYDGKTGWICNTCRFDKKKLSDWVVEGPTNVNRHSVISANKYIAAKKPRETIPEVMGGRDPKLMMDIHNISGVNKPEVMLSALPGPATRNTFEGDIHDYGKNVTDIKAGSGSVKHGTDSSNPGTA
jgi:NADH-quinone oxidoreductase subunit G